MSHNSSPLTPSEVSHYNDTRKPLLIGSFVVLLVLSNSAVIARGVGQWRGWRHLLLEDYLIFVALVLHPIQSHSFTLKIPIRLFPTRSLPGPYQVSQVGPTASTTDLILIGTSFGLGLHLYRVIGSDPNPPQHLVSIFKVRLCGIPK